MARDGQLAGPPAWESGTRRATAAAFSKTKSLLIIVSDCSGPGG